MRLKKSEIYRNEVKSYIVRTGMTMIEVVDYLSDEYGWSRAARFAMARPWSWRTHWAAILYGKRGGNHDKE